MRRKQSKDSGLSPKGASLEATAQDRKNARAEARKGACSQGVTCLGRRTDEGPFPPGGALRAWPSSGTLGQFPKSSSCPGGGEAEEKGPTALSK